MKKEKISYENLFFGNRWKQKRYSRNCDWVIIGVSKKWFSPNSFKYELSFFGLSISIWFKREFY